ncbi:hypothetical protein ACA877_004516 [Vibrio alginolyticus]|nr:hypothetical protein [Vibrio parahaemolyticus]EGQ8019908.1 hypothetical protein [Vibrio alginolyticus]AYO04066.1 hypothetical protein D0871_06955 [Vibrio parahaemolyticus]EGQ9446081.1 hypothetical protein [Vibrio parahaemolyticus]EGQ9717084.1 hypothetical protein [Vibrio alginolyticus]EGQ9819153.1 hypothetical protein [Vibrio parahaemolyticus]
MNNNLFKSLIVFSLVGCSTAPQYKIGSDSAQSFSIAEIVDKSKTQDQLDAANQQLLEDKLSEVLSFCLPRLSGYEAKSEQQARQAYWLSMSGLVAGSIAVPALTAASAASNAAWIAGLGGWAGATNFASQNLKESGLSGAAVASTRNEIVNKVTSQIEIAADSSQTFENRRNALMKARASCIMYEIAVPAVVTE